MDTFLRVTGLRDRELALKYKERPGMLAGMYLSATRMGSSWEWESPTTET